jgi:hypothetical protein
MAPSTHGNDSNGLQVASGKRAYIENPRKLAVPITGGMLISFSILYQSFYQLLFAKI